MKNSLLLLQEMQEALSKQEEDLKSLVFLSEKELNDRPSEKAWSALECLAHVNSYADFYIPAFQEAIAKAREKRWTAEENFHSTWIGRYSIQSILPENRKKRLNSPKQHNHFASQRSMDEDIRLFEANLASMRKLVESAKEINLNKAKVAIEIMPLLKLRIGDFFPFLILHQSRHMLQAKEAAGLNI